MSKGRRRGKTPLRDRRAATRARSVTLYRFSASFERLKKKGSVVAVGNACGAFSKERWARVVRPPLRQLPQTDCKIRELGHLVESALRDLRLERLGQTCASAGWTVRDIQWEVAHLSASTRVMRLTARSRLAREKGAGGGAIRVVLGD
jgi:hypothetical protein